MPNDPRSSGKKLQAALQILRSSVRLTIDGGGGVVAGASANEPARGRGRADRYELAVRHHLLDRHVDGQRAAVPDEANLQRAADFRVEDHALELLRVAHFLAV